MSIDITILLFCLIYHTLQFTCEVLFLTIALPHLKLEVSFQQDVLDINPIPEIFVLLKLNVPAKL